METNDFKEQTFYLIKGLNWRHIIGRFYHGWIKLGFATDNDSIDRPKHFYLKQHVFKKNAWFPFCHVFRMLVAYKIEQDNDIFFLNRFEKLLCFNFRINF